MHINVISNQGKDDTLEPAYFHNRLNSRDSSEEQLIIEIKELKERMNITESSNIQQDTKITNLETSQQQQDNQIDIMKENITETKDYTFSIVGDSIPASAIETPNTFAAWLKQKGWDLKTLANRASEIPEVIEGYYNSVSDKFYEDDTYTTQISGQVEKLYIDKKENIIYRFNQTHFIPVSNSKIIQVETLPSANIDELGNIYQYIGETNLSFVNGYFYKCVANENLSNLITYSWEAIEVQKTFSISDDTFNALVKISDELYVPAVQLSAMPTPATDYQDKVVQYTGTTTTDYVQGDFYIGKYSVEEGATWEKLTYNKNEINDLIAMKGLFKPVNTLPVTNIETNVIYLVPKTIELQAYQYTNALNIQFYVATGTEDTPEFDVYIRNQTNDQYIYIYDKHISGNEAETIKTSIDGGQMEIITIAAVVRSENNVKIEYINWNGTSSGWEIIGDTEIDLSNYLQYSDVDNTLSGTSERPVQNKVVTEALTTKMNTADVQVLSESEFEALTTKTAPFYVIYADDE